MSGTSTLSLNIPLSQAGQRLDQALASLIPDYSRSQLQTWIREGFVTINDVVITKPNVKVNADQHVKIITVLKSRENWEAEPIPLNIVYEDEDLIVINKPAGLVVHPGAGNAEHTLVNALLHYDPELNKIPRAGIIHRLDKETSGLLVIARSLTAHHQLTQLLKNHAIKREYEAIVQGVMISGGTIHTAIGRHPQDRKKMAVVKNGRESVTHYRVIDRFRSHTHIRVQLETGRTHQIRVHMAHIRHALVGDPVYKRNISIPGSLSDPLKQCLREFKRQALHAIELQLPHPKTGKMMSWKAPLPEDMKLLLNLLKQDNE